MKKTVWDLFVATGNTGYYRLYKKLDENESLDKSADLNGGGLQRK